MAAFLSGHFFVPTNYFTIWLQSPGKSGNRIATCKAVEMIV
jgi:hypothetical protein